MALDPTVETNRDKALRGEVVRVSDKRLSEMQEQAIDSEGLQEWEYHWHWACVVNELIAARVILKKVAKLRGIDLGYGSDAGEKHG